MPITLASPFDEPEGETSPEELIAAAHAGCFAMAAGKNVASQNNLICAGSGVTGLEQASIQIGG